MIVWINGTFGVGKTTTANELLGDSWRVFDPEHVGFLLAGNLRDQEFSDFQDLAPWRALVPAVADEIYRFTNPNAMVAVQTVLVADYWDELVGGSVTAGCRSFTFSLTAMSPNCVDVSPPTRSGARRWNGDLITSPSSKRLAHGSQTPLTWLSTQLLSDPK